MCVCVCVRYVSKEVHVCTYVRTNAYTCPLFGTQNKQKYFCCLERKYVCEYNCAFNENDALKRTRVHLAKLRTHEKEIWVQLLSSYSKNSSLHPVEFKFSPLLSVFFLATKIVTP